MTLQDVRKMLAALIVSSDFARYSYFVGGCVRDMLLNKHVSDIDITVALPKGGIALAGFLTHKLGIKGYKINREFGTASFKWHALTLETVMTRKEEYTPNSRFPSVQYGTLQNDIDRRDFTMNALLMGINDGVLHDLCGRGRADLEKGIIRTIGEPDRVFCEDPLRILRAIRFAANLEFEIEENTLCGMVSNAQKVSSLSDKKRLEELNKIHSGKALQHAVQLMTQCGLNQISDLLQNQR